MEPSLLATPQAASFVAIRTLRRTLWRAHSYRQAASSVLPHRQRPQPNELEAFREANWLAFKAQGDVLMHTCGQWWQEVTAVQKSESRIGKHHVKRPGLSLVKTPGRSLSLS